MTILVTGGAGFIGSALLRFLLQNTEETVVNVDKLTYAGNPDSLSAFADSPRYSFEAVDICDQAALAVVFERHRPAAVIHLAAETHVDRSIDAPDAFLQTNLIGTGALLQASLRHLRRLPVTQASEFRFLHVSTNEVYGDLANSDRAFTERAPYAPSSPYSATKAGADHLVRSWHRTYGLPTIISCSTNNFGPRQFPEKLIPHAIICALTAKPLPIYGDGRQMRDWLYVDDHVQALHSVLTRGAVGETYNVGAGNERCNNDVVRAICELLERIAPRAAGVPAYQSLVSHVQDRPGHDVRYALETHKLRHELGWVPKETFEAALEKTVRWYVENRAWWLRVLDGKYRLGRLGINGAV